MELLPIISLNSNVFLLFLFMFPCKLRGKVNGIMPVHSLVILKYIFISFLFFCWLQGHQYETVSGFICEVFGYIPRTGESIKVVLEKANQEDNEEYTEESDRQEKKERQLIFKLEVGCMFFCLCSLKVTTCK